MSDLETRYLRLLLQQRARIEERRQEVEEQLEDFVLEMRESGASARGIAQQLGVGASTVQGWTANARRRRDG